MTDMVSIGRRIKILREHARLSRRDFGKLFSSRETTVCEWENGHCVPRLSKLVKISLYFGVSLDSIVSGRAASENELERTLAGASAGMPADNVNIRNVERLLLRFHSLPAGDKERMLGYLDALHSGK